ncbi:hypothetical protein SAMN05446037_1002104 [Anaerovirgula multivorans]|uniref:Uncharacterized protein n=1 Tax=Anaerovirgula multivorans TaxID=312168 RepID=A0A239AKI3_9FIRM|nr:hypothetical protein [Anaerovirgula multivorans]SNR96030.1 hypothetical protein SAMN05446037_1002104 [Anaerovirgula multivorans]
MINTYVHIMLDREEKIEIKVSDERESEGRKYRVLNIQENLIFMTDEQLEKLLTTIDEALNEVTINDLENRIAELEDQLHDDNFHLRKRLEEAEYHRDSLLERRGA